VAVFHKTAFVLILAVSILGRLGQTAETAAAEPTTTVKVLVKDYAGVSAGDMKKARIIATRIYQRIGVDILWFGDGRSEQVVPLETAANEAFSSSVLVVNLHLDPSDDGVDLLGTMGMAAVGSRVSRVFLAPITQAAFAAHMELATVLGYVIAHELGHLLLPPNSHSPGGLMRATLDNAGARAGRLWFDETQGALIRVKLANTIAPALVARGGAPDGYEPDRDRE
jgi:hypothetical protein